jgi:hypothetical protein
VSQDRTFFDQHVKVQQALPVVGTKQDDGHGLDLAGLNQRDDFEQLIERAEATGERNQCRSTHHEMHFSRGEVMELETQVRRHVRVGALLVGQGDVQAHCGRTHFRSAAVGSLHDARAATRANEQAVFERFARAVAGH